MRIAVLTNAYPPKAHGGAGQIAALQVEGLRARGHEVHVWIGSFEWTGQPFWKRLFVHAADFIKVHASAKEIITWKPDVLLTHNLTGVGFRTPTFIQRKGIRWVHLLHDVQLFEPLGLLEEEEPISFLQKFVSISRQQVFGRPDVVCSPTDWLLKAHQRRGWFREGEKRIIPNPAPSRSTVVSAEWHMPPRCLYVGRVSRDKGAEILKELISSSEIVCEWRIVGTIDPEFKERFEAFSNVQLLGQRTSKEVREEMEKADLLFVPSQVIENQPTVILEALACGLPLIASDKGGIPETLGEAAVCLPANEINVWKEALKNLLKQDRKKVSLELQERWKRYDPEAVIGALEEVLRSNKKT